MLEITDYMERYLVDQFATLEGVASVRMNGARRYAMRVWLSRENLAARQLTVADVENSLLRENVELPAGRLESTRARIHAAHRHQPAHRGGLPQSRRGPRPRRLSGAARRSGRGAPRLRRRPQPVALERRHRPVDGHHSAVEGQRAGHLRARSRSGSRKSSRRCRRTCTVEINIDNGVFIAASLKNVVFALSETLILVLIVIFLFLGTVRATLIPAVTIPVSIIAAAIVMAALDYSINTLTLLGAVLAIGLVVDDAIVVLENIVRRIEGGEPPVLASINGSREIGFAVIATTLVLMAVFVPVSFMTGDTGRLFGEFGVTVAAAVGFSAFVALSLTPMMASKLFANGMPKSRMVGGIDRVFHNLDERYAAGLRRAMDGRKPLWIVGGALGAVRRAGDAVHRRACRSRACALPSELAPQEDRGMVQIFVTAPEGSSIQYLDRQLRQVEQVAHGRGGERQCAPRAHALRRLRPQRRGEHRPRDACRSISGTSATRAPAKSPTACASAPRTSPARAST